MPKPYRCRIAALVWRLLSDFEDDEPSKGEQNLRNAQLELCFSHFVAPVFLESLEPVEALQLSATSLFARDVLCGPRDHQDAHVCE